MFMHFHSALTTFEQQNHVVVEEFGAEIIPLIGVRFVQKFKSDVLT